MDVDTRLLHSSISESLQEPVLRLYGWENPTVTTGRNQSLKGLNLDYCSENNIKIVKRPTGGRALLHDNELTYSFICPCEFLKSGNSVISSYKEISEALIIGFKKLNIELNFPEYKKVQVKDGYCMSISTGSDLNYKGEKFIGSAQYRAKNYILQHGSIILDINKALLASIFRDCDFSSGFTTLKQITEEMPNIETIANSIKQGFEEKFELKFS
ncbi:MAG: lipoate--protein ligase family protein [Bacillus subtilis]|nr:lipoate--protein ligase family protein [Bacillus subtilis]